MFDKRHRGAAHLVVGLNLLAVGAGCGDIDIDNDPPRPDTARRPDPTFVDYDEYARTKFEVEYPDHRASVERQLRVLNAWDSIEGQAAPGDTISAPWCLVEGPSEPRTIVVPEGGMEVVIESLTRRSLHQFEGLGQSDDEPFVTVKK